MSNEMENSIMFSLYCLYVIIRLLFYIESYNDEEQQTIHDCRSSYGFLIAIGDVPNKFST